ncbi:hypothetical protein BKI52_25750 [marine bacterium AO1-C]|nr:hypothetical protein BKI52_25750 [marine bacterium AO1-C]
MEFAIGGIVLLVIAVVLFFYNGKMRKRALNIKYYETSRVADVLDIYQQLGENLNGQYKGGIVELVGQGVTNNPLTAEHSGKPALYYRAKKIREYEKRETVRETDINGKLVEKEVIKKGTETVSDNTRYVPFYLQDDSGGQIKINIKGATKHTVRTMNTFKSRSEIGSIDNTTTKGYRYIEDIIPLNARLYVLGQAVEDSGELTIAKPSRDKDVEYIVSTKSEQELIKGAEDASVGYMIGAIFLTVTGIVLIIVGATSGA